MEETSTSKDFPQSILEVDTDEQKKNNLTNAFIYCKSLLEAKNLLTNNPPTEKSATSIVMGEEIFKEIINMLEDRQIVTDECLITAEECNIDNEEMYYEVCYNLLASVSGSIIAIRIQNMSHNYLKIVIV